MPLKYINREKVKNVSEVNAVWLAIKWQFQKSFGTAHLAIFAIL